MAVVLLATVAVFADVLVPSIHSGFGWYQRCGVVAGGLIVLLGALLRADVVALGGLLVLAGAVCADWFGAARAPGMGWKQQVALGIAMACGVLVLVGRRATVLMVARAVRFVCGRQNTEHSKGS